jgi:uncharacterized protein (DUF433 family)
MTADVVDTIPLSKDVHGVYRVGNSRVTLDLVVRAFNRGATPENIAQDFPSLQLADIYRLSATISSTAINWRNTSIAAPVQN